MEWAPNGQLRPRTSRPLTPDEDAAIVQVCPGINQTGPFNEPRARPHDVWGDLRRVVMAWAADPDIRLRASTGGVMTAINRYLLDSRRVAFVLQLRASQTGATESEPVMVRDPTDLLTGSQSRYASSAPLAAVRAALELNEPFAVSLKPCDIAGIRNLQREDERAQRLIVYTQTFFCGTVLSLETTMGFLRREGVDPEREYPETLRWRGNGCPGPTVATMPDGRQVTGLYNDMWDNNPWTTQFSCKICPDAIELQSDIATGDTWPGAVADGESEGTNVVIARTALGEEVLAECERLGYLETRPAEGGILDDVQPHHARLRQTFSSRLAGAMVAGTPTPNFSGLAEDACAAQLSTQELGTVFR
jgi:coenzyme F420 hydrogenase subunit beta